MTLATPRLPNQRHAETDMTAALLQAGKGNRGAFAEIYARYLDTVFKFVWHRVRDRDTAEDLTADTFVRALNRAHSWTDIGRDPGAWLITIARNLVADHYKSGKIRLEHLTGEVLDADVDPSPDVAVEDYLRNRVLLAAVQQLKPEQRECIVLRFFNDYSIAETAAAMGKNEGAIKALQYRAVAALRRHVPEGLR